MSWTTESDRVMAAGLPPRSFLLVLASLCLFSRILLVGPVYFTDGPRHIRALGEGEYFIQPPGYFLFMKSADLISQLAARGESMPKARFVKEKDVVKEKDCAEVRE